MGWSADGKWLYILDWSGTKTRVLRLSPAGGTPEPLFEVQFDVSQEDGSACPDGTKFVVTRIDSTSDVWLVENFDPDVQRP
jgi:sugar lactone lactonase YvrE